MLKRSIVFTTVIMSFMISFASAADVKRHLPIENAMENGKVKDAIYPEVALYFAGDQYPAIIDDHGVFKASKKTNTFMKEKVDACEWAFASAIVSLQRHALEHDANAVVEITSNIKNRTNPSNTEYDCLTGSMMVNVAFRGRVVKLAK